MSKSLIVECDVDVPMRDGTILRADVYRPNSSKSLPVVLERTPYGKGFSETSFALFAAEQGYAVVLQDTRGRWNSAGEGYPFLHEKEDGYDTVEWVARQSWANGSVGMFGGSYVGYTQYAAASLQPPSLKTIIPFVAFTDPRSVLFRGGALSLGIAVSWNLLAGAHMAIMREPLTERQKLPLWAQFIQLVDGMARRETFEQLPLKNLPFIGENGLAPFLSDALLHQEDDDFWEPSTCQIGQIKLPALHIGGWYDCFINPTLDNFTSLQKESALPQRLLVGPWVHGSFDGLVGEVDFGIQAYAMMVLPDEIQLRWFDQWLKGKDTGILDEPPVRIFVMGDNVWRNENEWPLARTIFTRYYLHSNGAANTLNGNGTLYQVTPGTEPPDSFVYDPRNPVTTRGGSLCCWNAALPPGAYDQHEIEERPDVLVYSTSPLDQDIEITGPIKLCLYASTTVTSTDFTAKLVDVGPCGYAMNIQDGIIRTNGQISSPEPPLHSGEIYELIIDLGATSNVFKAGHRIRLEISSSNFPNYDRNPNTGQSSGQATEFDAAHQTIFHNGEHASYLLLPIIPG